MKKITIFLSKQKIVRIVPMFCIFADLFNIWLNGILIPASAFNLTGQVASPKLHSACERMRVKKAKSQYYYENNFHCTDSESVLECPSPELTGLPHFENCCSKQMSSSLIPTDNFLF